jgi:flagellar FliL protein
MKKKKIDPTESNSPASALHPPSTEEPQKDSGQEKGKAALENGESKTKPSKKFFFLLGFAGLVVLVGGLGAAAYLGWIGTPAWFSSKKPPSSGPAQPAIGPMIKLTPLIINLHEDAGDHYIKTTLVLEVGQRDWLEEVQTRVPSIIDMLILSLGDKKMEELRRPELREELKKELLRKANQHFPSGKIKQIYFDEFLYQ